MALLKCHECNHAVSSEAQACPNCGAKVRRPTSKSTTWIARAFLLFIGAVILRAMFSETEPVSTSNAEAKSAKVNSCENNYKACVDNKDLINNYDQLTILTAKSHCQLSVEEHVRYGTPEWDWDKFGNFFVGDDFIKTGVIRIVDNNVKIENMYGAKVHTKVGCAYDLESKKVLEITIDGLPITISTKQTRDTSTALTDAPIPKASDTKEHIFDAHATENEFNKSFRCPESFNDEAERKQAFLNVAEWYFVHNNPVKDKDLNAKNFLAFRMRLLKSHNCDVSLNNIQENNANNSNQQDIPEKITEPPPERVRLDSENNLKEPNQIEVQAK